VTPNHSVLPARSPKFSAPDIDIQYDPTGYWLVDIRCKDRNKLLFDTVCTLADMNYDVYHATINSCDDMASQEFYIKPRYRSGGKPSTCSPSSPICGGGLHVWVYWGWIHAMFVLWRISEAGGGCEARNLSSC
jgi:hypothetical protein